MMPHKGIVALLMADYQLADWLIAIFAASCFIVATLKNVNDSLTNRFDLK